MNAHDIATAITALPTIPGVTVHLDETGDYAEMTVTSSRRLTREEISACHYAAGELGASIEFHCPR
jgi:hypothetical protein